MKILAFESSCDETAVAVVENGRKVLSDAIASQADMHALYGGVVPEIASRKHVEAITGLADNGCAMATNGKKWKPLALESGRAYAECALEDGDTWWFGNLFVADDPAIRFTHVPSMPRHPKATVEIFNPTDREISATILDVRQNKSFRMSLQPRGMVVRDCD